MPSPSTGRVRGLKESTHISAVQALHFGLADGVSTPTTRQLTTNKNQLTIMLFAFTFSFFPWWESHYCTFVKSNTSGIEPSIFPL